MLAEAHSNLIDQVFQDLRCDTQFQNLLAQAIALHATTYTHPDLYAFELLSTAGFDLQLAKSALQLLLQSYLYAKDVDQVHSEHSVPAAA